VANPAKVGRDAGDLRGLPPQGVVATNDATSLLEAGADAAAFCASGDV